MSAAQARRPQWTNTDSLVAAVLVWLAYIVEIAAFFAILFTKRFPKGIFDFVLIALSWRLRASAYANWMTARYPPFVWAWLSCARSR